MKTIITTISLVILLQFSFSTAVNAVDVRQTCIEGLNENAYLIFNQSEYNKLLNDCVKKYSSYETKSYSSSSNNTAKKSKTTKKSSITPEAVLILLLFPIASLLTFFIGGSIADARDRANKKPTFIYLVIYYVPISLMSLWLWSTYFASSPKSVVFAILIGLIFFTKYSNSIGLFSGHFSKKMAKNQTKKGSGKKKFILAHSLDTPEKYDKFYKIKGRDFKDERKINRSAYPNPAPTHPIDDEQFIGNEYAFSLFFQRNDLKFKKQEMIALANYYGAKYNEKDTIKVIQEKLYDALESELSSGRFQNSYRVSVVSSFNFLAWHSSRLHKSGKAGNNADDLASSFDNLIKYYEKIAQSSDKLHLKYHYEKVYSENS